MVRYEPLDANRLSDVACCPGGIEVEGKSFRGDLSETAAWRRRMLDLGMRGILAYDETRARGFAEYMPAETAPFPIVAPGAAVLMCYHWAGAQAEDPEHLAQERALIERVIEETRTSFAGLVTQGWDVPTHFPIPLLDELGFHEVAGHDPIALMWLPFADDPRTPTLAPAAFAPRDRSSEGVLAIDAAFSARCPYSLSTEARLKDAVSRYASWDRIRPSFYRIDTHEDAFAYAVPPFDWAWVFFNGEEVEPFAFPGEELSAEIARRIEALDQDACDREEAP